MIDVATLGAFFQRRVQWLPDFDAYQIKYLVAASKNSIATLGVGFPTSCPLHSLAYLRKNCALWRRHARRRFFCVMSCGTPRLIWANMASCVCVTTLIVWAVVVGSYVISHVIQRVTYLWILSRNLILNQKIFTETRTQGSFRVCILSTCNLLSDTNKFCLRTLLLLCLVLELHKASRQDSNPGQISVLWRLFFYLLFETNNFGLGAVLLSCLVSELQKPFSLGIEPRTIFSVFWSLLL
jgi:hypothetical protein